MATQAALLTIAIIYALMPVIKWRDVRELYIRSLELVKTTSLLGVSIFFFLNDPPPPKLSPLPLRDALPISRTEAPRVGGMVFPAAVSTVMPSIEFRSSGRDGHILSMICSFNASDSVMDTLLRTASSAQRTFRLRFSLIVRMKAAASFVDFSIMIESSFSPPIVTGCAAP